MHRACSWKLKNPLSIIKNPTTTSLIPMKIVLLVRWQQCVEDRWRRFVPSRTKVMMKVAQMTTTKITVTAIVTECFVPFYPSPFFSWPKRVYQLRWVVGCIVSLFSVCSLPQSYWRTNNLDSLHSNVSSTCEKQVVSVSSKYKQIVSDPNHACALGSTHSFRYSTIHEPHTWSVGYLRRFSSTGLLTAMFGAAGTLVNISTRAQNLGKVPL